MLTRNNLVGNNINVTLAVQNTRLDRGKVFDKIITSMVKNCVKNLDLELVEQVLATDNITRIGHPYENFLTFDKTEIANEPIFDEEDLKLLKIIYKV